MNRQKKKQNQNQNNNNNKPRLNLYIFFFFFSFPVNNTQFEKVNLSGKHSLFSGFQFGNIL